MAQAEGEGFDSKKIQFRPDTTETVSLEQADGRRHSAFFKLLVPCIVILSSWFRAS